MISLIIFIVGLLIAGGSILASRSKNAFADQKGNFVFKPLIFPIVFFVFTSLTAAIQPYKIERVNAGCVGIQVKLAGSDRGVTDYSYKTGWVVYNKWTTQVVEIPTTFQHVEYKDQPVTTKGGFPTVINPTFNYSVKPSVAGDMYVNLRSTLSILEQGWIKTAIVGATNDVANKWTIDSIFNNLGLFELSVKAECNLRLDRWFLIDQLRINITPPEALKNSIAEKTKAIQDVQVAENQKKVIIAQGQSKVAKARADSTADMITALTEVAIIKAKQQQLTPMYIEWLKVTTWKGDVPTTVVGNGNGMMLNLGN